MCDTVRRNLEGDAQSYLFLLKNLALQSGLGQRCQPEGIAITRQQLFCYESDVPLRLSAAPCVSFARLAPRVVYLRIQIFIFLDLASSAPRLFNRVGRLHLWTHSLLNLNAKSKIPAQKTVL